MAPSKDILELVNGSSSEPSPSPTPEASPEEGRGLMGTLADTVSPMLPGVGDNPYAQAMVGGVGDAVDSIPGQIAGIGEALTTNPATTVKNMWTHATSGSIPNGIADVAQLAGPLGGLPGIAVSGAMRGAANWYDKGLSAPEGIREVTSNTLAPFALPSIIRGSRAGASKVAGLLPERVQQAPLATRLRSKILGPKLGKQGVDFAETGTNATGDLELVLRNTPLVKELTDDGIISGANVSTWVPKYADALNKLYEKSVGTYSKPVGKMGETLGDEAATISRAIINTPAGTRSMTITPRLEKLMAEKAKNPEIATEINNALEGWRSQLDGGKTFDSFGQEVILPGVQTIKELNDLKKQFSLQEGGIWKDGQPSGKFPEIVDQAEMAFAADLKDMLLQSTKDAAQRLGTPKAIKAAEELGPLNEKWSRYIEARRSMSDLGKSLSDPSIPTMGVNNVGRTAVAYAAGGPAAVAGALGMMSKRGMGMTAAGLDTAGGVIDAMRPMGRGLSSLGSATVMRPDVMSLGGAVNNMTPGMEAQAQSPLPRTPEAVRQAQGAISQILPPELQPQFWAALEGDNDDISEFMGRAVSQVPALAQMFMESKVSPTEFGNRFDDPMTTYGMFQNVTSKMLRGELDPLRAYREQKDVVRGRVPRSER